MIGDPLPFQIKICGITSAADARLVAMGGADAVGLNFYPLSARFLSIANAVEIAAALAKPVCKVGLFVNAAPTEIKTAHREVGFDLVQLHGDEPPEAIARLAPLPVLRAFRLSAGGLPAIEQYLARCAKLNCLPAMVLLDAHVKDAYGGTGQTADWQLAAEFRRRFPQLPLVLAGGLTAANVADAISAVRPAAVDTASGVESSPGHKDRQRVIAFVEQARAALSTP